MFVVASVTYLIVDDSRQPTDNPGKSDQVIADGVADVRHRVIAYYFHGAYRCPTCRAIEEYAREGLRDGFPDELQSGMLEWRAVNVEEPQNEHFTSDYELLTRSLVLVDMEGENQTRWKNLERVWDLVGDREAFVSYVQEETTAYLGEH
jgi:hypothetical protein